jgi:hypothetical protein
MQRPQGLESWSECRLPGDELLKRGDEEVAVARNEERRHGHRRSIEGSHELRRARSAQPN